MFGKDHIGNLGDIGDPMEEDIDVPKGRKTHKNAISMKNLVDLVLLISFMS